MHDFIVVYSYESYYVEFSFPQGRFLSENCGVCMPRTSCHKKEGNKTIFDECHWTYFHAQGINLCNLFEMEMVSAK